MFPYIWLLFSYGTDEMLSKEKKKGRKTKKKTKTQTWEQCQYHYKTISWFHVLPENINFNQNKMHYLIAWNPRILRYILAAGQINGQIDDLQ